MSIKSKPGTLNGDTGTEPGCEILEEKFTNERGELCLRRYQKGRFLGKGGFAKCYEVRDLVSGRILAAKIIDKSTLTKGRAQQKLMSEIRIHRSMNHPSIVRFEGYFEDPKCVYMLLEMCPNQTLKETVKRRKRLHELEVQCYLSQLIPAMKHIHSMNVIHRDLKLGNLFLGKGMELKVGDFGLAAKLDFAGERRRTVCGTPNYIAPEVLDSKVLGHSFEADIWSLGVIVYTMLVGKPPFETSNVRHTYKRIRANDYHIPEDAHISDAARGLIHRILVLNPSKRPSLAEILEDRFMTKNPIPPLLPLSSLISPLNEEFLRAYTGPNTSSSAVLCGDPVLKKSVTESTGPTLASARPPTVSIMSPRPTSGTATAATILALKTNNYVLTSDRRGPPTRRDTRPSHTRQSTRTLIKPPSEQCLRKTTLAQSKGMTSQAVLQPYSSVVASARQTHGVASGTSVRPFSSQVNMRPQQQDGPIACVEYYLDYTDKYGVGYVLNSGVVGFYYNDMTNLLFIPQKNQYAYTDYYQRSGPESVKYYSAIDYPADLKKKVKIMTHFSVYYNRIKEENQLRVAPQTLPELSAEYCAVKRVIKTKNGLLLKLTNNVLQTFFNDKTQLTISFKRKTLIYMDKKGAKESVRLANDFMLNANERIVKRYKYTMNLLSLLSAAKTPPAGGVRLRKPASDHC